MQKPPMANQDCPKCHGTGLQNTGQLFYKEECECVLIERIRAHVKELEDYDFLTSSPLLPYLNDNRSIIIETADLASLKSHLKTCLILNKQFKSFKIVHAGELVELSITNPKLIEGVDLLVEIATPFPHYEKASSRHEFTLSLREAMNKSTWFVVQSLQTLLTTKEIQITPGFRALLGKFPPPIKINKFDTDSKKRSASPLSLDVIVNRGYGLSGVDQRLLSFHPEIDKRLQELRKADNGR